MLEGFNVLTFDYRGWGDSDGSLVQIQDRETTSYQNLAREQDKTEQQPITTTIKVRIIRQTVDMTWQLEDIDAAVSYILSLSKFKKIGLWGTSQAGGHVLEYAGRDPENISCVVSQVPSVGKNGAGGIHGLSKEIFESRIKAASSGWIPAGAKEFHLPAMDGAPLLRKLQWYDPLLSCARIRSPTLIIDSENEELWDRSKNGKAAFDLIPPLTPKKYHVLRNSNHYDAYDKSAKEAREVAVEFFKFHLASMSKF